MKVSTKKKSIELHLFFFFFSSTLSTSILIDLFTLQLLIFFIEDKIPALLEEAGDWMKLHLCQPDCYLRLTTDRLEVLDFYSHKPVHWFPYLLIRR